MLQVNNYFLMQAVWADEKNEFAREYSYLEHARVDSQNKRRKRGVEGEALNTAKEDPVR